MIWKKLACTCNINLSNEMVHWNITCSSNLACPPDPSPEWQSQKESQSKITRYYRKFGLVTTLPLNEIYVWYFWDTCTTWHQYTQMLCCQLCTVQYEVQVKEDRKYTDFKISHTKKAWNVQTYFMQVRMLKRWAGSFAHHECKHLDSETG